MEPRDKDLPACWYCEHDDQGFPCRDESGNLALDRLAQAYLAIARHEIDGAEVEASEWASDCVRELVFEAPELAFRFILAALPRFTRNSEIAFLAAGPLEDLVNSHGTLLIDKIERETRRDRRFRYLLSGIWGMRHTDPDVWQRIQKLLEHGPWLDHDPRTPQGSMD